VGFIVFFTWAFFKKKLGWCIFGSFFFTTTLVQGDRNWKAAWSQPDTLATSEIPTKKRWQPKNWLIKIVQACKQLSLRSQQQNCTSASLPTNV